MSDFTTADTIAAYVGGGLVITGTVGIGLLETLAGSPHPVGGDGQIIHEALIPLEMRSYVVLLGLAIWGLCAVYKVVASTPSTEQTPPSERTPPPDQRSPAEQTAPSE